MSAVGIRKIDRELEYERRTLQGYVAIRANANAVWQTRQRMNVLLDARIDLMRRRAYDQAMAA